MRHPCGWSCTRPFDGGSIGGAQTSDGTEQQTHRHECRRDVAAAGGFFVFDHVYALVFFVELHFLCFVSTLASSRRRMDAGAGLVDRRRV